MTISKSAEIKNCHLDSNDIDIDDGAKLIDVHMKARKIILKSNATLTNCKLFSDGTITIGEETTVKESAIINAFKSISIGDRTIVDRDVFVGGMQSEKSQLNVGNDCVILYRSYLNTTCAITIGNEVGIGGYCLIFTHSAWKNVLEGNPYKFSDVEIKDNVWIPWKVTILPSVTIEKEVIVGAGSVVTKSLPPAVFAAGVPAKIIKKQTEVGTLSIQEKNKIVLELLADFKEYVCNFIKLKNIEHSFDSHDIIITYENEKRRLVYTLSFGNLKENDTVVAFKIPSDIKRRYNWIEFDTLKSCADSIIAQHFIRFVRRYGIRIHPLS